MISLGLCHRTASVQQRVNSLCAMYSSPKFSSNPEARFKTGAWCRTSRAVKHLRPAAQTEQSHGGDGDRLLQAGQKFQSWVQGILFRRPHSDPSHSQPAVGNRKAPEGENRILAKMPKFLRQSWKDKVALVSSALNTGLSACAAQDLAADSGCCQCHIASKPIRATAPWTLVQAYEEFPFPTRLEPAVPNKEQGLVNPHKSRLPGRWRTGEWFQKTFGMPLPLLSQEVDHFSYSRPVPVGRRCLLCRLSIGIDDCIPLCRKHGPCMPSCWLLQSTTPS